MVFGKAKTGLVVMATAGAVSLFSSSASAFTLSKAGLRGWSGDVLVFHLNPANCPSESEVTRALDAAISLWNAAPSARIRLERGESVATTAIQAFSGTAETVPVSPVIICDPALHTTASLQTGDTDTTPGLASTTYDGNTINYGFILLNAEIGAKANIGVIPYVSLEVILAHEIGHVLGLGHSADQNALMYYNASKRSALSLGQDDIMGLTYLYPRHEWGGDGPFGCGTVSTARAKTNPGSTPPPSAPYAGELVGLFLLCLFGLWISKRGLA